MTEIVKELREKGLTLAQIAHETGKSVGWVNARTPIRRVKGIEPWGGDEVSLSARELLSRKLKKLEEKGIRIRERQTKRGEVNLPLNRTAEELEEYRKGRDARETEKLEEMP